MIRYIEQHRDRFGVEPICQVLAATDAGPTGGYYAAISRPTVGADLA